MDYIAGESREQSTLFPELIDDFISNENPVRFIEAFVEGMNLSAMGFKHSEIKQTGRPPYNPKDLLKLYVYGYLNRIRSSRNLERESQRNLEVIWLLKKLNPDHKTISDFRRNNIESIMKVFKEFIGLCKKLELFSSELVAVDSTKFRASNARDRIKDKEQLEKSLKNIEVSITEYMKALENNDKNDEGNSHAPKLTKEELQKKISLLNRTKDKLTEAKENLEETKDKYVSLTDSESRLVKNRGTIQPGYSLHTSVDSKHSLILDYELSQEAVDNNHLSKMAISAKEILEVDELKLCADAGYYNGIDVKKCQDNQITAYVPIPEQKVPKETNVPQPEYRHEKFTYEKDTDCYGCPEGQIMQFYHIEKKHGKNFRVYRTPFCKECKAKKLCTTSPRGRYVYRWEEEHVIDQLRERLVKEAWIIKKRKAIVEHPFGTMKAIWGYSTFLLRGLKKITTEVSLMTLAYNIRRAFTIVGVIGLIKAL